MVKETVKGIARNQTKRIRCFGMAGGAGLVNVS